MDKNRKSTLDRRAKGRAGSNAKKGKYTAESAVETSDAKTGGQKASDADAKSDSSPSKTQ